MSSIFRDLRYAIRMLFNSPGISIIAIVALALGVGVTTTMYSIVYGALLRGLPFEDGNRIYTIDRIDVIDGDHMSPSIHDYLDWRERQTSFEDLGGLYTGTINIVGTDSPDRYDGAFMSANSFNILGVRAALGRTFLEDEDSPDAELVVVLSHHVWRDRYGSDREVVGRVIRANGEQATIVGVMPEGFLFPVLQDVCVPLRLGPASRNLGTVTVSLQASKYTSTLRPVAISSTSQATWLINCGPSASWINATT